MNTDRITATLFALFVATVVAANWALNRWGIVPIGFGLMAPAGVYFAGLAFGLRDALHDHAGRAWVLAAILTGALVSLVIADAVTIPGGHVPLAVASGLAFLLSETIDLLVYTPLRDRQWAAAVVLSNIAGAVVDSALFLWLAFGSIDHWTGQVIGKTYMVIPALVIVGLMRRRGTFVDDLGRRYRPAIWLYHRDDGTRGAYIEGQSPVAQGWFQMEPPTDADAEAELRALGFTPEQIAQAPSA